jgi:hypothetical protein
MPDITPVKSENIHVLLFCAGEVAGDCQIPVGKEAAGNHEANADADYPRFLWRSWRIE